MRECVQESGRRWVGKKKKKKTRSGCTVAHPAAPTSFTGQLLYSFLLSFFLVFSEDFPGFFFLSFLSFFSSFSFLLVYTRLLSYDTWLGPCPYCGWTA